MPVSKFHPSIDKIELKKIPKKGDENEHESMLISVFFMLIEKSPQERGRKLFSDCDIVRSFVSY